MMEEMFMKEALKEAELAFSDDEVPVGAVILRDGEIVGRGRNGRETLKDPTCHAEIMAIRDAAARLGGWRLHQCEMYVTMEPCPMCAGAILQARIKKLYIGAMDPKGGACGSLLNLVQDQRFNHYVEMETGILESECRTIVRKFFNNLREKRGRK